MKIKNIIFEDFIQYKKCSMFIGTAVCNFKCDKLNGCQVCQNMPLAAAKTLEIDNHQIATWYKNNVLANAIVFGGLDPIDQFEELLPLIHELRQITNDEIIIYTGYDEKTISEQIQRLKFYPNLIVKFGPFLLNRPKIFDEVLGVWLSSDNQYAKRIS